MDTIFALATARGKSGVAIVRISGPTAKAAAETLAGPVTVPRRAMLRQLRWRDEVIDEGLVIWFEAGGSFTGEDVIELQVHGSRAVVDAVLDVLSSFSGLRLAEPGEFTRRALENGRLDLAQVEGLADLIDAETAWQRRQAMRVLAGDVGKRAMEWRDDLLRAEALLAVMIDFSDEDVPQDVTQEIIRIVDGLIASWRAEVAGAVLAERVRDGFEVAIVGAPNAGKSTLLNALAGREAAITSAVAGTTRDVIEVRMDLRGLAVTLLDTAGLRETADELEALGIARARRRAESADLRVFLMDGAEVAVRAEPGDIFCLGKADLRHLSEGRSDALPVSGLTGEGVAELLDRIATIAEQRMAGIGTMTRQRHSRALGDAIRAMESAGDLLRDRSDMPELVAENFRAARQAMEALVGRFGVEDVLGEIFSRFCIGK